MGERDAGMAFRFRMFGVPAEAGMSQNPTTVDIGTVLDDGPFSLAQKMAVLLAAFAIVMDGFDGQLIGFAIPVLIKEWGITRNAFAPAVAAGLIGMGLGSALAGLFADRFGRRLALIGSVFLFGVATCSIGFAPNVATIAALRFIAGLGIGGALPSSTTMTAEFTPGRRRTLAVTATIVCVPLGGMLAGLFAGHVLPLYGWRGLFWIGGALPLVLGFVLVAALPESPRFLARRQSDWPRLAQLLTKMERDVPANAVFADVAGQKVIQHASFRSLFARSRPIDVAAMSSSTWYSIAARCLACKAAVARNRS